MSEASSTEQARAQRLERWRALLSGAGVKEAEGARLRRGGAESVLFGVWLHAAARVGQGLELTELERSILAPLCGVLGEEEVLAIGQLYLEQRAEGGSVAALSQAVVSRSLQEGFGPEEYKAALAERLPQIAELPNVAVVDRAKLAAGEDVDTPEFTAALAEYGYGVTAFTGKDDEKAGAQMNGPFRARLEWRRFFCDEAVGDQGGGRDEIYWTAASNATGYQHTTRTGQTGEVTEGKSYPISGDHRTGSLAFFDTRLDGCGSVLITLWEADQSNAEWYTALGKALNDAASSLALTGVYAGMVPGLDLYGHMVDALGFISQLWEAMRNKDDLVLSRGLAFGPEDLAAMYYTTREFRWKFDASDDGMGNFTLYVGYTGDEPPAPSGMRINISSGLHGLSGTDLRFGIDAACNDPGSPELVWMFRGSQYVKYDAANHRIVSGPTSIGAGWPGLAGTNFASKVDAACSVPGSTSDIFLFSKADYMRYNTVSKQVVKSGLVVRGWPALVLTVFALGIEAACPVPGSATDVLLFRYDRYVRYNMRDNKLVEGPAMTSDGWPALANTPFIVPQAACSIPGSSTAIYIFRDSDYTRNTV
ncbi:hypothetical protein [Streptomyces decoyicus]|uniref:hypothetical protein n=1 Tax=Streptomyces decoyicus TaxID=249567 RepID=UPI00380442DF